MQGNSIDLDGGNGVTIAENQTVAFTQIGNSQGNSWTDTSYNIKNKGTASVSNSYFLGNLASMLESGANAGAIIQNKGYMTQIVDSYFTNNKTEYKVNSDKGSWGGIIGNAGSSATKTANIDLIKKVTFSNNIATTENIGAPHGGIIFNMWGTIGGIDNAVFKDNTMTPGTNVGFGAHGTGIDNNQGGVINKITNCHNNWGALVMI